MELFGVSPHISSSSLISAIAFVALLEFGREELGHLSGVLSHCIRCIGLGSLRGFGLIEGVSTLVVLLPSWPCFLCGVVAFVAL